MRTAFETTPSFKLTPVRFSKLKESGVVSGVVAVEVNVSLTPPIVSVVLTEGPSTLELW
jgi:hypothetical protein